MNLYSKVMKVFKKFIFEIFKYFWALFILKVFPFEFVFKSYEGLKKTCFLKSGDPCVTSVQNLRTYVQNNQRRAVQHRHISLESGSRCQIWCQFVFNLVLVYIATNLPNSGHILKKKKHKVVVFRNLIWKVVVLC